MEQRTPIRKAIILVCPLLMLLVSGCASNSQPRLEALAEHLAPPGSQLSQGIGRLRGAGFTCDPRADTHALTCTRMRSYALLATCVQRITLFIDPAGRFISRIDVPPPACASL